MANTTHHALSGDQRRAMFATAALGGKATLGQINAYLAKVEKANYGAIKVQTIKALFNRHLLERNPLGVFEMTEAAKQSKSFPITKKAAVPTRWVVDSLVVYAQRKTGELHEETDEPLWVHCHGDDAEGFGVEVQWTEVEGDDACGIDKRSEFVGEFDTIDEACALAQRLIKKYEKSGENRGTIELVYDWEDIGNYPRVAKPEPTNETLNAAAAKAIAQVRTLDPKTALPTKPERKPREATKVGHAWVIGPVGTTAAAAAQMQAKAAAAQQAPKNLEPETITIRVDEIDHLVTTAVENIMHRLEEKARRTDPLPFYGDSKVPGLDPASCPIARSVFEFMQSKLAWKHRGFPLAIMQWTISEGGYTVRNEALRSPADLRERIMQARGGSEDIGTITMRPNRLDVTDATGATFTMAWTVDRTLLLISNAGGIERANILAVVKAVNWPVIANDVSRSNATIRGHWAREEAQQQAGKVAEEVAAVLRPAKRKARADDDNVMTPQQYEARIAEIEAGRGNTRQKGVLKAHAKRDLNRWLARQEEGSAATAIAKFSEEF